MRSRESATLKSDLTPRSDDDMNEPFLGCAEDCGDYRAASRLPMDSLYSRCVRKPVASTAVAPPWSNNRTEAGLGSVKPMVYPHSVSAAT